MRFRRKLTIVKGLSLNFSGSGMSLTAGVRGASVTIGKKGTYLNTGIPGTGLYNRTKISGSSHKASLSSGSYSSSSSSQIQVHVEVSLDDKGKPVIKVTDSIGRDVYDESVIRKVKQTDNYKSTVERLMDSRRKEIEDSTNEFINIFQFTPEVLPEKLVAGKLEQLELKTYQLQSYTIEAPKIENIQQQLEAEAEKNIHKTLFWKNKSARLEYVKSNLDEKFQLAVKLWESRKQKFIDNELKTKEAKDKEYLDEYESRKSQLQNILYGESAYVNHMIETIISEMTLPAEFSINYEYYAEKNKLLIDLDLPEIEDLPKEKVTTLSSGKISIKEKSEKELKSEYARCVCGMAYFLAGTFFNITTQLKEIVISGYTQRMNKAIGVIDDQYIYSVKFNRQLFSTINFSQIDPVVSFTLFENKMNVSASYDFKTIEPMAE